MKHLLERSSLLGLIALQLPLVAQADTTLVWRHTATAQHYGYQLNDTTIATQQAIGQPMDTQWQAVAYADFDNNGSADILLRHQTSGLNYIYFQTGAARTSVQKLNQISDQNWQVAASADFNGDGYADILWRNKATGANYIYWMQGATILQGFGLNTISTVWQLATTADLNGDGQAELIWRNSSTGDNYAYFLNGQSIAQNVFLSNVSASWDMPFAGDVNGDGKDDLIWRNTATGDNAVYLMDGTTRTYAGIFNQVPDLQWSIQGVADFNGDGKDDILWRHGQSGLNYLYRMNGTSVDSTTPINTVATSWSLAGVAEYTPGTTVVTLSSISLSADSLALLEGGSAQLSVSGAYSDGSQKDLTSAASWSSSNSSVLTVSNGLVNAVAPGSATITVSNGGKTDTLTVTVTAVDNGLYVYFQKPDTWGDSVYIYAWGGGSSSFGAWPGSLIESVGSGWYRQELTDAHLDSSGCFNLIFNDDSSKTDDLSFCNDEGTANYQTDTGWTVGIPDDLNNATLTSIQFTAATTEVGVGQSKTLSLVGIYDNSTSSTVTADSWSSSDSSVATVSNGTVTAVKTGTATITASKSGLSATTTVQVVAQSSAGVLYFKKPDDWTETDVYAYVWTQDSSGNVLTEPLGTWPGGLTTAYDDSYYGIALQDSFASADGKVHVIFNAGSSQTNDLETLLSDGTAYYENSQWNIGNPLTPKVLITFNGTTFASGSYEVGKVLTITADLPLPGTSFVVWSVSGGHEEAIADLTAATTQLTVPDNVENFNVTAIYGDEYSVGRDYYSEQCVVCHGTEGQGTYPLNNLAQKYTQASLTTLITDTMPMGNTTACVGECATETAKMLLAEAYTFEIDCSSGLIPSDRGIRLLSRKEYQTTLQDLTGLTSVDVSLVPDVSAFEGFDNYAQSAVSESHINGYLAIAEKLAGQLTLAQLSNRYASCGSSDTACQINAWGERVFRRPLTSTESSDYTALAQSQGESAAITALLISPNFLYRSELGATTSTLASDVLVESSYSYFQLSDYEIATLLSYTYLGTMPTDTLYTAAKNGQLHTAAQVKQAVANLLLDARAQSQYGQFVLGWMDVRHVENKGHVTPTLAASMLKETETYATQIAFSNNGFYQDLFSSNFTYLDKTMSDTYGFGNVTTSSFQMVMYPESQRRGILGHASVLAETGVSADQPNIIRRGLFVREQLLCQELGSPPPNGGMLPDPSEVTSTRDFFAIHSDVEGCNSCHQYIDPVGFGTENFDGLGRFQTTEDYSGTINALTGQGSLSNLEIARVAAGQGATYDFQYITGLADLIGASENAKSCYVRQYFRFMKGDHELDDSQHLDDTCTIEALSKDFKQGAVSLKAQLQNMTQHAVFSVRKVRK